MGFALLVLIHENHYDTLRTMLHNNYQYIPMVYMHSYTIYDERLKSFLYQNSIGIETGHVPLFQVFSFAKVGILNHLNSSFFNN